MSEFFKEVEFVIPPDPSAPKAAPVVTWDKEVLAQALERIEAEIVKIRHGTSKHTTYAIDPGGFGFPSMHAVKVFVEEPSDKTFAGVPSILKQDFGPRAATLFKELLNAAREEQDAAGD